MGSGTLNAPTSYQDEVARNRGALENNFRPESFLSAPLHYLLTLNTENIQTFVLLEYTPASSTLRSSSIESITTN